MQLKVFYITCVGHSGSTLLDLLISSHPQVVSVGEIKRLRGDFLSTCACGAKRVANCPFWTQIDAAIQSQTGRRLHDLDPESPDHDTFVRDNALLFRTVAELTGTGVIVDSSKSRPRLKSLMRVPDFEVIPIRLIRRPQGVVFSYVKRGHGVLTQSHRYTVSTMETYRYLRRKPHVTVTYHELATHPEAVLRRVMPVAELEFEPEQLQWAGRERHNVGGNAMRRSEDSTIRPDISWREGLSRRQRLLISLMTIPTRLPRTPLYELYCTGAGVVRAVRRHYRNPVALARALIGGVRTRWGRST